jgi:hypothetical protein
MYPQNSYKLLVEVLNLIYELFYRFGKKIEKQLLLFLPQKRGGGGTALL